MRPEVLLDDLNLGMERGHLAWVRRRSEGRKRKGMDDEGWMMRGGIEMNKKELD